MGANLLDRVGMYVQVFITLFPYVLYRILHAYVAFLESLYVWIAGYRQNTHLMLTDQMRAERSCQVYRILWRCKSTEFDLAREKDFLLWPQKLINARKLLTNPKWTLYCLDSQWVYLIHSELTTRDLTAKNHPFMFVAQFTAARRLAKVSIATFCRLSEEIPLSKGRIIYLSNTPRSGTTLLTKMFDVSPKIFALSEPDVFTDLSFMKEEGSLPSTLVQKLCRCLLLFTCREMQHDEFYLIKTQSNGGRLCTDIHAVMPEVKHIYLYRRNFAECLQSIAKVMKGPQGGDAVLVLNRINRRLSQELMHFTRLEPMILDLVKPRDCLDYAFVLYVAPHLQYMKAQRFGVPIHTVCFETLRDQPAATMKSLFHVLGISENLVKQSVEQMKNDSQAGTALSQESLRRIPAFHLTAEKMNSYALWCDFLGLPRLTAEHGVCSEMYPWT